MSYLSFVYRADIYNNPRIPNDQKKAMIVKELVGSRVITRYNNKTYKIDDISFDSTPQTTFERREGAISYTQYYKYVFHHYL